MQTIYRAIPVIGASARNLPQRFPEMCHRHRVRAFTVEPFQDLFLTKLSLNMLGSPPGLFNERILLRVSVDRRIALRLEFSTLHQF
jgi:hypothetical protein